MRQQVRGFEKMLSCTILRGTREPDRNYLVSRVQHLSLFLVSTKPKGVEMSRKFSEITGKTGTEIQQDGFKPARK